MKVVKGILELDFVEMSEVTATANSPHVPSQPPPPPIRPAITDISQWAERFSLMAAIVTTRFPHKSLEFWAAHNVGIRMNELIIQNWEVIQRKFKLRGINFPNFKDDLLYGKLSEAIHHPHANYVFVRKSESKDAHYACRMTMEQQRAPRTRCPVFGWFLELIAWAGTPVGSFAQPPTGRQTAQQVTSWLEGLQEVQ